MNAAIIVAAGLGTRMGPNTDKLFVELAGRPVVGHTWRRLDSVASINEIILVVRSGREPLFEKLAMTVKPSKPYRLALGGEARQDSVWNGLCALTPGTELVAIQDGARPCTTRELIERTLEAAEQFGAAVAAQRVTDTIKQSEDGRTIANHLDRGKLWSVQTPQCFRVEVIQRALEAVQEAGVSVTDDTAACELIGQEVVLVESQAPNPKLTSASDILQIDLILRGAKGF